MGSIDPSERKVPLTSVGALLAMAKCYYEGNPFTTRIIDNIVFIANRRTDERISDHDLGGIVSQEVDSGNES